MNAAPSPAASSGLLFVGTEFGCGKTAAMVGISASLSELGFHTRAIKPIAIGSRGVAMREQTFINSVTKSDGVGPHFLLERQGCLKENDLLECITFLNSCQSVTLVEMPGLVSTPISYDERTSGPVKSGWMDVAEIARQLDFPCLLIGRHDSGSIEKLVVSAHYLVGQSVKVIGLITVETEHQLGLEIENNLTREDYSSALLARTGVPFLGCIKYSPSINVQLGCQGNLIKVTSHGIDLLAVQKHLDLQIPESQPAIVLLTQAVDIAPLK